MRKSDGVHLCSPFLPHLQPLSGCYMLLPLSGKEGTVPDLEVLILLSPLTQNQGDHNPSIAHPLSSWDLQNSCPPCPAAAGSDMASPAGPGEQGLLSLLLPRCLPTRGCAHQAGREELLQRGRHWAALTPTAGAEAEHSSVQFGTTSPQTPTFCHGSSHKLCH